MPYWQFWKGHAKSQQTDVLYGNGKSLCTRDKAGVLWLTDALIYLFKPNLRFGILLYTFTAFSRYHLLVEATHRLKCSEPIERQYDPTFQCYPVRSPPVRLQGFWTKVRHRQGAKSPSTCIQDLLRQHWAKTPLTSCWPCKPQEC